MLALVLLLWLGISTAGISLYDDVFMVLFMHDAKDKFLLERTLGLPACEHLDKLFVASQFFHLKQLLLGVGRV